MHDEAPTPRMQDEAANARLRGNPDRDAGPADAAGEIVDARGVTDSAHPDGARGADLERRIAELEIKTAWAEDLLEQLNATVFRQQETIELLLRELLRLREQQQSSTAEAPFRSLRDELPPHY